MATVHDNPSLLSRGSKPNFTIHDEDSDTVGFRSPLIDLKQPGDGTAPLSTSKMENVQIKKDVDLFKPPFPMMQREKPQAVVMGENSLPYTRGLASMGREPLRRRANSDEENLDPIGTFYSPTPTTLYEKPLISGPSSMTEVARLQEELNQAKNYIARQAEELNETRLVKQNLEQTVATVANAAFSPVIPPTRLFSPALPRLWPSSDDGRSGSPERSGHPWSLGSVTDAVHGQAYRTLAEKSNSQYVLPYQRQSSGSSPTRAKPRVRAPYEPMERSFTQLNIGEANFTPGAASFDSFANNSNLSGFMNTASSSYAPSNSYSTYQPQPIGPPLHDASLHGNTGLNNPWNSPGIELPRQTYVSPTEPLNYRRLLDRTVTCNWKYIVDKIVCNNDQQASIFLQQKLKVGTPEQKYEIVESIVAQAYPLMINRFGNFLVQRCFEHGSPKQIIAIANAIQGNTLTLSMDPFGCHVIQKAFDAVPEKHKATMVHELLRRIPETVIHRYACHVWQKLFELRWSDSPPQIMKYVNNALRGMWHEVALGETGSLVVQNIFENCLEDDKRPCVDEVMKSIDIIAHGQFGNWCIQHICEHGTTADRSRAIDHVLHYVTEYSMDQFASKVVEKCLKIGHNDFLERYLERVCKGRSDRPRIPLIDIASDQYGNYLIQYILTHASPPHRDIVASHIRKHMVSLRGSKFGSRVGMLCNAPNYTAQPIVQNSVPASTRFSSAPANLSRFSGTFR